VPDPTVQDVVVELGAELGAVVGLDHLDLERQLLEHVIQEPDGALLVQPVVVRRTRIRVQSSIAVNW
jgi:hypothetical protein